MRKINQGRYEIFTTKSDAINKFMQMQGICREELSDENHIEFYCLKNGKITITNPPRRRVENENSTNLYAEVVEQDRKTYVTYYTSFSKINNVLKSIFLALYIIFSLFAIVFTFASEYKLYSMLVLFFCLAFFVYRLFIVSKEKTNFPKDSETLVKELEKRVEAVNLWDK